MTGESSLSTPAVANASTEMELLKGKAAVQTKDCRKYLNFSPRADRAADLTAKDVPKQGTSAVGG